MTTDNTTMTTPDPIDRVSLTFTHATSLDADIIRRAGVRAVNADNTILALPTEDTHLADLRTTRPAPERNAYEITTGTFDSFTAFLAANGKPGDTVVFVDSSSATAYLDFRNNHGPAWQTCAAMFPIKHTEQWQQWKKYNDQWASQILFLEFLEDHKQEIVEPSGAEFYDMAANFRAQKNVEYTSAYRTSDGQTCISYTEANKGIHKEFSIPELITINIPVIKGAEEHSTYQIKARIRTRIEKDTNRLSFMIHLINPEQCEDNAVQDIVDALTKANWEVYTGHMVTSNHQWYMEQKGEFERD